MSVTTTQSGASRADRVSTIAVFVADFMDITISDEDPGLLEGAGPCGPICVVL